MIVLTTDTQFHKLETILANVRADTKQATFPVEAVRDLVRDHITLLAASRSKGHIVEAGQDQESLK